MMTVWPQGTVSILIRVRLGTVNGMRIETGKEISAWAARALCDGYDGYNLRMLAGLDLDRYPGPLEATTLFSKVLSELRGSLPIEAELPRVDSDGVTFTSVRFVVPLPGGEVRVEGDGVDLSALWSGLEGLYPDELVVDPSPLEASATPHVVTFQSLYTCCALDVEVVREGDRVVWRRLGGEKTWPGFIAFPATLYEAEHRRARAERFMALGRLQS